MCMGNKMGTRLNIAELEPGQLNSECITIMTMFARELERHNGEVVRLTERGVMRDIIRHAHDKPSAKLEALYDRLKVAIKRFINSAEFDIRAHEESFMAQNARLAERLDDPTKGATTRH